MNLSPSGTDLYSKLQSQLAIINSNILYLTRQTDLCVKWLKEFRNDLALQKQVDDFNETSPQTESDTRDLD